MAIERGQPRMGEVSLTAVTEAVSAVMRASSPAGVADETMAGRLGMLIRPMLAEALRGRITSGSELVGQAAFRSILSQHLAFSSPQMDEQARQSLREFLLRNANRTGADFAAFVSQHLRGGDRMALAGTGDNALSGSEAGRNALSASGERFSGMPWNDSQLTAHAHHHGVPWMANHPELLRLGPATIELFARTNFQRESFERLQRVGFEAPQVQRLVRYAERYGHNPNRVAETTENSVRIFANGNPQEEARWRGLIDNFYGAPENPAARDALGNALTQMEQHGTPAQRDQRCASAN